MGLSQHVKEIKTVVEDSYQLNKSNKNKRVSFTHAKCDEDRIDKSDLDNTWAQIHNLREGKELSFPERQERFLCSTRRRSIRDAIDKLREDKERLFPERQEGSFCSTRRYSIRFDDIDEI